MAGMVEKLARLCARVAYALVGLGLRLVMARVFFISGQAKIEGPDVPIHWSPGGIDFSVTLPAGIKDTEEDAVLALKYYELGCEYGAAEACFNLGNMLAEGRQVPMDMDKAYLYFERACVGGDDYGCRAMAARR